MVVQEVRVVMEGMVEEARRVNRHRWPRLAREQRVEGWGEAGFWDGQAPPGTLAHVTAVTSGPPATRRVEAADPAADAAIDPDDELFLLGERCAQAYIEADALQYRAMRLLAEFHRRNGWQGSGFGSTAEWLAWRIGIKPNAARERLRTALALEGLPRTCEAMKNGELSFAKVRALTRVATAENEGVLLEFAMSGSANNLERVVRGWKTMDRKSENTAEQIRHRSRRFSAFVDEDGMVVVRGRLDPEVGAALMRAVEAASDVLFRGQVRGEGSSCGARGGAGNFAPGETDSDETRPEQRRADAIGLIAERALAAGLRDGPVSGSRAERFQVMLHVDADTLQEDREAGVSELEDGTRVSAETARRIACDCGLVNIALGPDGQLVGAGRRVRTVSGSLRRALEARDRGCRFPGCGGRHSEGHHVRHWADGGETTLRNTVLLCRRHHRAVHEGGVRVCIDAAGQVVFFTPRGKALAGVPPRGYRGGEGSGGTGAADEGIRNDGAKGRAKEGIGPDGAEGRAEADLPNDRGPTPEGKGASRRPATPTSIPGSPRWKYDRDIPWDAEARVWEALDSG